MITNQFLTNDQPVNWPQNRRAAAMLTIDVDTVTPMLWRKRKSNQFSTAEIEQRSFGLRQGVGRLLAMLDELELKAVFFVPSYVAETNPHLVKEISSRGHELGLHGHKHEEISDLDEVSSLEILKKSKQILSDLSGQTTFGYRSPSWDMKPFLLSQLEDLKVIYDSSLMGMEQPYRVGNLIELPVSWGLDDAPYFIYLGDGSDSTTPKDFQTVVNIWRNAVYGAMEYGSLINLTVHPWIIGRMERIAGFKEFLKWLKLQNVWIGTGKEIVSVVEKQELFSAPIGIKEKPIS